MKALGEGLWIVDHPLKVGGAPMGTRMTMMRLDDGGLALHSPVPWTPGVGAAVEAAGSVAAIVAPNRFHHLFVNEWRERHPNARLLVSAGLVRKRRDLAGATVLGDEPKDLWGEAVAAIPVEGSALVGETAFVHRPSRTLVVADLLMNFVPPPRSLLLGAMLRFEGVHGRLGVPRLIALFARDKAALRASLRRVLDEDFDRLAPCHGGVLASGARAAVERAFAPVLR